jgi:L-asparaginase / beta-aspartyl-peptidase
MYAIAIHGGAGVPPKTSMTKENENAIRIALRKCLNVGEEVLRNNGTSLDAVTTSVCALEDDPLFNAGCGAVFNSKGKQEMDAAIMSGIDRDAGAVAGIFGPKNPVLAARAVMERTEHVFLIGPEALRIAKSARIPFFEREYFFTQARWTALQEALRLKKQGKCSTDPASRHGTVGAVALDVYGNLAAATSTGGMTGKSPGRVGDSPCIGSGTYADNEACAVSATGHGEEFIKCTVAAEIAARIRYKGQDVMSAASEIVEKELAARDGSGGLVAVDRFGNIAMPFNCYGMYRAYMRSGEDAVVAIY